jgi:hypothetical protein
MRMNSTSAWVGSVALAGRRIVLSENPFGGELDVRALTGRKVNARSRERRALERRRARPFHAPVMIRLGQ